MLEQGWQEGSLKELLRACFAGATESARILAVVEHQDGGALPVVIGVQVATQFHGQGRIIFQVDQDQGRRSAIPKRVRLGRGRREGDSVAHGFELFAQGDKLRQLGRTHKPEGAGRGEGLGRVGHGGNLRWKVQRWAENCWSAWNIDPAGGEAVRDECGVASLQPPQAQPREALRWWLPVPKEAGLGQHPPGRGSRPLLFGASASLPP